MLLFSKFGVLAQLGEHLPYKQRVIGSSPIGPISFIYIIIYMCRSGGTGRRPGLKIPWVEIPVPVRSRSTAERKPLDFQGVFSYPKLPIVFYDDARVKKPFMFAELRELLRSGAIRRHQLEAK